MIWLQMIKGVITSCIFLYFELPPVFSSTLPKFPIFSVLLRSLPFDMVRSDYCTTTLAARTSSFHCFMRANPPLKAEFCYQIQKFPNQGISPRISTKILLKSGWHKIINTIYLANSCLSSCIFKKNPLQISRIWQAIIMKPVINNDINYSVLWNKMSMIT